MAAQQSCRCSCCLLRGSDRELTTPYTYLGKTEIYSDMLAECFDINLKLPNDYECGICDECVGRLRDASAFKLQVQRSQAELQARLRGAVQVKDEIRAKVELSNDVMRKDFMYELVQVKQELSGDDLSDVHAMTENHVEIEIIKKPVAKSQRSELPANKDLVPKVECASAVSNASQTCLAISRRGPSLVRRKKVQTYTCDTCGKQFANRTRLIAHLKIHNKVKDFSCEVCGKEFTHKSHLVDHRRIHTGDKPYSCETCGKCFGQISALIVHKRIHTGEKPYTCDVCNKSFAQISGMYTHKRIHEAKAYTCNVCNKAFSHKNNLIAHKRIHTGEKPFHCEFCEKQFSEQSSLKRHKRIHTGEKPYTCETCDMKFRDFSAFSCHKRTHTGEKPYTCEICNKQFGRKNHLDRHKHIHTGDKPFCCEICGKQYTQKFALNTHKLVHSKTTSENDP